MALASNALTTLAALKDELGITDVAQDSRLERYINQASAAIERHCEREFQKKSRSARLAGNGTRRIVVDDATPLVSITSIVDDGETIDSDTYYIENADAGIIIRDTPWPALDAVSGIACDPVRGTGQKTLVVTYLGGYVLPNDAGTRDLPHDIEAAALITAVSLFRSRGADRRVASESLGDYSVTMRPISQAAGMGAGGIIPDDALPLLAPFRRVVAVW